MDKQQLKDFVQSVAEIKELKPATSPTMRLDDTHQNDVKVGNNWIHINKESNPTLGFKFVKLKDNYRPCQLGCGDMVNNQVVESRVCSTPVPHWRTRCDSCGCFVSPDGQGFIEGAHQVQAAFMRYFRGEPVTKTKIDSVDGDREITIYQKDKESKWTTDAEGNIRLKEDQ